MHSGFLIALWVAAVAMLQLLPLSWLTIAATVAALATWRCAAARGARLLRRVRFLLLAIVVFFGGFTPGEALWPDFPLLSPTREGAVLALEHGGRLFAVVLCVALLLEHLSADRLVGGLYSLLRPFQACGLPAGRLAVRLMLVLRYVESAQPGAWRLWIESGDRPSLLVENPIRIARETMGRRELVVLLLLAVGAVGWLGAYA